MAKREYKVSELLEKLKGSSHVNSILDEIVRVMGGPGALAIQFKAEFDIAEPGSPTRTKLMDLILGMLEERSRRVTDEASLAIMEDEDLEAIVRELLVDEDAR